MEIIEELTKRNQAFAGKDFDPNLGLMPSAQTIIISCVDPRVDPAYILGLQQGEAVVIRNLGGRFVPSTVQTMGMLSKLAQKEGARPGSGLNLVIVHHTDCGISHLADEREMLAGYFGIDVDALDSRAVTDPRKAVAVDVAIVKANPLLPANLVVSGLVYDVKTGLIEVVVPPAPLRTEERSV